MSKGTRRHQHTSAVVFALLGLAVSLLLPVTSSLAAGVVKKPPPGHPRVYVRPNDLPAIRAKLSLPAFRNTWEKIKALSKRPPEKGGPFCSAFIYLMTGDKQEGRRGITGMLSILKKTEDARTFKMPMHAAACTYDWCYPLLTADEKNQYVKEFQRIARLHSPGYPARNCNAVVGHATEGWLLTAQLPAGAAIYDETPEMFDAAAKLFFEKFVEVRDFYYPSHAHHQGDSYGSGRFVYDLASSWLFRRMGYGDVLSREQQFVPYHLVYCLRPDKKQIRRGDSYDDSGRSGRKSLNFMLSGTYYNDPYLLSMADDPHFHDTTIYEPILEILFRDSRVQKRPLTDLPLTRYFAGPMGEMVARTGWTMGKESRDAVIYMRIGEYFFGNHQCRDWGTFQIYYRGALAIATGLYEGKNPDSKYGSDHWKCWLHQTIAHNGMLVFDPAEPISRKRGANDGGQIIPNNGRDHPGSLEQLKTLGYKIGEVKAHEFGPDEMVPEYSYIAGDITKAYTKKVSCVTRSMVTLNLKNRSAPAALIVFDRVASANPAFKKTWLLHSIQEPAVSGTTMTVVRNQDGYGGKLVTECLLPLKPRIVKIGGPGKEFWLESTRKNYFTKKNRPGVEPGAWRVEVSPNAPAKADLFLHAMTAMDDKTPKAPPVQRIDSHSHAGAQVLDRVVLFGRSHVPVKQAKFKLEGTRRCKVLVCDLVPGKWSVSRAGRTFKRDVPVTEEGRCLYFEATAGEYALRQTSTSVPKARKDLFWERLRKQSKRK